MKENKLLYKESTIDQEEKTKYEIFEENLKNGIYSVYYLLLKNQETTFWKFILILIIEYLQLLSFAFDETVRLIPIYFIKMIQHWRNDTVVKFFSEFMSTFRVVFWLKKLTWDVYVIVFYIIIFLLFIIIIDFLYISISFKHKRFSFMQPVQLLRIGLILMTSILYIPFIGTLIDILMYLEFFYSISQCEQKQGQDFLSHQVFGKEVVCFASIHLLHACLSYLMALLFILMCVITTLLHYENRYTKDPTSRTNSRADLFQLFAKNIYCFIFIFLNDESYSIVRSIALCIFSSVSFITYISYKPYFNNTTQTIVELFSGVFAWTTYILLLSIILKNSLFNGALEIYFLGIPIICIIIYTRREQRLLLLMTSENQIQKGIQIQKKIFFYLNIIDTKESDRCSAIILKGYINHHVVICPYDTCPIKQFKKLMEREKMASDNDRKRRMLGNRNLLQNNENNSLLLSQGKALYRNGIKKFPKHTPLRVDFANFLQSKMKDRKGALNELSQAERLKPGIDEQFHIYRYRKIIEDELTEGSEHGGADFIAALNFEAQFKQFRQLIEKTTMLHYEFWNHLVDDSPDLVRLSQQGAKINVSIQAVNDAWKRLSKMSSNTPKALKMYASYLIDVLNDKETGNEQMIKAKESANLRVNYEFNNVNEDFADLSSFAQDGTPCIYISGEQEKLGIITQCNMSLCKIFGLMKKDDVLNRDIEILMPKVYSKNHKQFLNLSISKTADQISSRERQVFGLHCSGFVFPLWLQIKNLPSLLSGRQYVGTFKIEKIGINKQVAHIILNKNKEILDISPSCIRMLGISLEKLHKKTILYELPSLLPQLFQGNQQVYQNKAGSLITYYFPRIVENQVKKESEQKKDEEDQDDTDMQDDNTHRASYDDQSEDDPNLLKSRLTNKNQDQDEQKDDDNDPNYFYQYKAIGNPEKSVQFQCNMTEIFFELISQQGGYHIRLETIQDKQVFSKVEKKVKQLTFQFGYDPINKKFLRELRDVENKEYLLDKNFLALKQIKEQIKSGTTATPDQEETNKKFQNMTYMSYLNRQQRIINKGTDDIDDEDDDEDVNQSQESSEDKSVKKGDTKKEVTPVIQNTVIPIVPQQNNNDVLKYFAGEGFGKDFLRSEVDRLYKLMLQKQSCADGVHTFIRVENIKRWEESKTSTAGFFTLKNGELPKVEEEEEEIETKKEKDKDQDNLKTNVKSKKAFSMAINDKTMPPAIKRLSRTAQIIITFLIALAIAEYSIVFQQFTQTKQNFIMIEKAYERTAEIMKVVYNARTMIVLNENILTKYGYYINTKEELASSIKSKFQKSLDQIYSIQNEINLSQLPLSDEHNTLLTTKSVNLFFKEDATNMRALKFSLTEAILQISSTIFTISNMKISDFNQTNEDIFFLMYNSFNDFYIALTRSSTLYVQELNDRASEKLEATMVVFILSAVFLSVCILILIPVIHTVNQQKDRVLSLFCEIDNSCIRVLALRCERFLNQLQSEEGNEDLDSNEDIEGNLQNDDDDNDEYSIITGGVKRVKKAKGKTKTDKKFFLKFVIALVLIFSYYLANYLQLREYVGVTYILNDTLNVTCATEPFQWFSLNTFREMIYDDDKPVINQNSFNVTRENIYKLYDLNNDLQKMHLNNEGQMNEDYWNLYIHLMRSDLCESQTFFQTKDECTSYISGMLTQGLHATFVRFFETLRTQLNNNEKSAQKNNRTLILRRFNMRSMQELYLILDEFTQPNMRELVDQLGQSIQSDFSYQIQRRIATFIVFLIVILIAFFLFWLPFLNSLNFQIYKTKLMLMIIPLEILMKMKNVGKVLQSQSLITNSSKKKSKEE